MTTLYVLLVRSLPLLNAHPTMLSRSFCSMCCFVCVCQLMDAAINGTADATQEVYSQADTILVLICQLFVRVACFLTVVGLLASSRQWRDEYLLQYSGVFCVSLVGLILCLFLRVYRVTLASYPTRYPTVLTYWSAFEYSSLLLAHTLFSLLFYYYSIVSAFRIGSSSMDLGELESMSSSTPTVRAALHQASRRR